ncbi:MAG: hypothetical protein ACR2LN_04055 [Candidatus Levyibacteriota bacterium]
MENTPTSPHKQSMHSTKRLILWLIVGFLAVIFFFFRSWTISQSQNPQLAPPKISPTPISSGDITLTTPGRNEHVPQDFIVTGTAKSKLVGIRLLDTYSGHVITEVRATTNATQQGQFGLFGAELSITDEAIRSESPLELDIFIPLGRQELNKMTIPLTFTPVDQ